MVKDDEVRTAPLLAVAKMLVRVASIVVPSSQREEWTREWQAELWHLHHSLSSEHELTVGRRASFLLRASGSLLDAMQLCAGDAQSWRESFTEVGTRWVRHTPAVATALLFLSLGIAADALLIAFARVLVESPSAVWMGLSSNTHVAIIGVAVLFGTCTMVASVAVSMQLLGAARGNVENRAREWGVEMLLVAGLTAWLARWFATYGMNAIPSDQPDWQAPPNLDSMVTSAWIVSWLCGLVLLALLRRRRLSGASM